MPSVEEQMPHAVVALPWFLALPWLFGLLLVYILKAAIYLIGFVVILVVALVQVVRER
jgi:hypothetical protein